MRILQFGSTASTVATILALQNQQAEKRQELARLKIEQPLLPSYIPPVLPTNPNHTQPVRFCGTDPITTWILTSTADTVKDNFLKAGEAKYKKVEKYGNCPSDMKQADEHLLTAKHSSNPSQYYQTAEDLFVKAASETPVHTTKSHAFRRAAIAAKLKGDTGAAKSYLKRATSARYRAEGPGPSWQGPETDLYACKKECYDTSTHVTNALKLSVLFPLPLIEGIFTGDTKKSHKLMSPYSAAIEEAQDTLEKKYKELEGEESDSEWINDNDPVVRGNSKRKGIRHSYL